MYLEQIQKANDIKNIPASAYNDLAEEIREFLIKTISVTGGHLGSNLGAVELTMALHLSLDLPNDEIIWDVGHQSYTHKILTGRREGFVHLRQYGGMSGFPKRGESDCDAFDTGHSSTSISAGLGLVKARDLKKETRTIVSVIGDGSLTGGMAYEALNNASRIDTNFIIILNDNEMSISENVGGMSKYLNSIRTSEKYLNLRDGIYYSLAGRSKRTDELIERIRKTKRTLKSMVVPGMFFEDMGITYLGPVDGHNIDSMLTAIKEAKKVRGAVIIHVLTQKGRGYEPAIKHPARFHGAEPFEVETGLPAKPRTTPNYTDIFSTVMCKLGRRDPDVVAITAAMPDGTGLKRFRNMYPDRFFDVGIAEEHAVTFAAGLAAGGLKPIVAVYSSFLQRGYDQIIHDVCLQKLPVVFAIDRAGLVGSDGETHQGIFDLSYLSGIPDIMVMAPKNLWELSDMIKFALASGVPAAVRYPRGTAYTGLKEYRAKVEYGKSEPIYVEKDILLYAVGSMVKTAEEVRDILKEKGLNVSLTNARFVKPIDREYLKGACASHHLIVTMEENVISGGFGEHVSTIMEEEGLIKDTSVIHVGVPDTYVEHGSVDLLKKMIGLDAVSISERILKHEGKA
ncbi:1-deoxy-D-xylulose-5-phosphate synthase [Lachnospiraceae bacterium XBB2008]|nr:1-deoxy-D-xylulose-5-phosphate synthase [Lachnospiraceae bacterium XBB2008]